VIYHGKFKKIIMLSAYKEQLGRDRARKTVSETLIIKEGLIYNQKLIPL
jgi:hypothetical protein